jgi:hypothetical protein
MKWKIEGTDHSGDDVIVMVEADDVESATKQANFAGVKVKAIHPDEATQPAVRLPPTTSTTTPGLATPPPGYSGKVIVEREDDDGGIATTAHHAAAAIKQHLHLPGDAGTLATIASHIVALVLFVVGLVVVLHGWIQYGRVYVPPGAIIDPAAPAADVNAAVTSSGVLQMVAWQQSATYIGHILVGLSIIIIAILIEGFVTRMVINIRDTWHKR